MSREYTLVHEGLSQWINSPNNGGECCQTWADTVDELNRLLARIKRLEEAVSAYQTAYTPDGHVAPHDCFATGPLTGDPIQDLIVCPGCWAARKAKEAKP